jgi:deoxycytidylate deaminase
MQTAAESEHRPELFFALVGAAGARLDDLSREITKRLELFGYKTEDIRLSKLLDNFEGPVETSGSSEFERIRLLQKKGNSFGMTLADGAALARAGIAAIRERRAAANSGNPDQPASARAYILQQLKRPDETDLLRQVYGPSFMLVAGYSPRDTRAWELAHRNAIKVNRPGEVSRFLGDAHKIIDDDENQEDEFGQNTRDTYPQADFFSNLGPAGGEIDVSRFVDLLFAHPFITPTPEEYAMYQASSVSLRSSDNSRQVGAVIVSLIRGKDEKIKNADVIAVGMNEVPRGGGGFYWDGDSPDARDQNLLRINPTDDRAKIFKISALAELIEKIKQKNWLHATNAQRQSNDLAHDLLKDLKRTQFMDIGEFGRPVHAEMTALIDAARRGVAVNGHSMYVTTFPCHNCAKHIIAAGLRRVVYLEPYPKSRAYDLYKEEVVLESIDGKEVEGRVVFFAFNGVGPRQYRQLFSMSDRGEKKGIQLSQWEKTRLTLSPRNVMRNASNAYLAAERQELVKLRPEIYKWDKARLCPKS